MRRPVLRFGREVLWPSTIASQWYCELKTHLEHEHPEVELRFQAMDDGENAHAAVASVATPTPTEVIEANLQSGKAVEVFEWILEARRGDVLIRGKPDLIDVAKRQARVAYELKFSRSDKVWPSQEIQAKLYGWLLQENGFDTSELTTAIVLFPPIAREADLRGLGATKAAALEILAADGMLDALIKRVKRERARLLKTGDDVTMIAHEGTTIQLARYDHEAAVKKLDWALQYWRGEREPLPVTRSPGKCSACPMNAASLCPRPLTDAADYFHVTRSQKRVIVTRTT